MDGDNLVFSALSLMTKEVIGDTGIEVTNKGVSRIIDDDYLKQHIYMNLSVKFLKGINVVKLVTPTIRRWLTKKVSSITSNEFTVELEYNEADKVYEAIINMRYRYANIK